MSINKLLLALKGGSGSGNFAHSGRPGKIGGSAAGNNNFAAAVDESLRLFQQMMRQQYAKPPESVETSYDKGASVTSKDVSAAVTDVESAIRNVDKSGKLVTNGNMVNLVNSDKFAMLGISVEQNASIVLRQLYMRDEYKGGGAQGTASQLYTALGKLAANYGDGKLHVYSPGEYTKQKRFWDRVPNAVME